MGKNEDVKSLKRFFFPSFFYALVFYLLAKVGKNTFLQLHHCDMLSFHMGY